MRVRIGRTVRLEPIRSRVVGAGDDREPQRSDKIDIAWGCIYIKWSSTRIGGCRELVIPMDIGRLFGGAGNTLHLRNTQDRILELRIASPGQVVYRQHDQLVLIITQVFALDIGKLLKNDDSRDDQENRDRELENDQ